MGMGDVKLVAMLGLYLGRAVAPAILIALVAGVVIGAGIIARRGMTEGRKTPSRSGRSWPSAVWSRTSSATRSSTGTRSLLAAARQRRTFVLGRRSRFKSAGDRR